MPNLLMDTDSVSRLASQLRQTSQLVRERSASLQQNVQYMPWEGYGRESYVQEVFVVLRRLQADCDRLQALADLTQREVAQWIETDSRFGAGMTGVVEAPGSSDSMPTAGAGSLPTISNMRELAEELFSTDGEENRPFRIVQINTDEYVILLKGTQDDYHKSNNWGAAVLGGLGIPTDFEREVRNQMLEHIPANAKIHFVGHSQGGITANNVAENQDIYSRYHIGSVTTFGSPVSSNSIVNRDGSQPIYNRFAADMDLVPLANLRTVFALGLAGAHLPLGVGVGAGLGIVGNQLNQQTWVSSGTLNPRSAHIGYSNYESLERFHVPFSIGGQTGTWEPVYASDIEAKTGLTKTAMQRATDSEANLADDVDILLSAVGGLGAGSVNVVVDSLKDVIPYETYLKIDQYRDRAMDDYSQWPRPTAIVSNTAAAVGESAQQVAQQAGEALHNTSTAAVDQARQLFGSMMHLVPDVF